MSQLDLHIVREAAAYAEGDLDDVSSEAKAVERMCALTGLMDKAIAVELGIDPAMLSKAQSGIARLTEKQISRLCDLSGSNLWLYYWMQRRGLDPHSARPIESKVEAENRVLKDRVRELERERELTIRILKEVRSA